MYRRGRPYKLYMFLISKNSRVYIAMSDCPSVYLSVYLLVYLSVSLPDRSLKYATKNKLKIEALYLRNPFGQLADLVDPISLGQLKRTHPHDLLTRKIA